jgi:hypothetical protein
VKTLVGTPDPLPEPEPERSPWWETWVTINNQSWNYTAWTPVGSLMTIIYSSSTNSATGWTPDA